MKKTLLIILSICQISCLSSQNKDQETALILVDETRVVNDLKVICTGQGRRNYKNLLELNRVADYIAEEFKEVCDSVDFQEYEVRGNIYKNVIGSLGIENKERIIIGAHYDVAGDTEGADDNASGVVGLLELARLLSKEKSNYRIDFVAYTLEEPPFFRTSKMGSFIHAKYVHDNRISVKGMICLESIGYYNDNPNSQEYPIQEMELMYGNKGNFITVVQNEKRGYFSKQIETSMKTQNLIKTEAFIGNSSLPGVDFSDHLNYWKYDIDAVMITNTAFYRNKNYHTATDKIETLDVKKMCLVIEQLFKTIKAIK